MKIGTANVKNNRIKELGISIEYLNHDIGSKKSKEYL